MLSDGCLSIWGLVAPGLREADGNVTHCNMRVGVSDRFRDRRLLWRVFSMKQPFSRPTVVISVAYEGRPLE